MTKEDLRKSLDFVNEERERLQQRIDKAIEYIKIELKTDFDTYYYDIHMRNKRRLLNILRGEDNE